MWSNCDRIETESKPNWNRIETDREEENGNGGGFEFGASQKEPTSKSPNLPQMNWIPTKQNMCHNNNNNNNNNNSVNKETENMTTSKREGEY